MGIWDYTAEQRGTPQPQPQAAPQPAAAQMPGDDDRNEERGWTQARAEQMAGVPWGGFGTYGNWAQQFANQHGGRMPGQGDEADFWDSQLFAAREGRGPTWGEWRDRWESGFWNPTNEQYPWQYKYAKIGQPGYKYYGAPWESARGQRATPEWMWAMAAPDRVPWGLRQGLIPWMERRYQPAVPAAQAAGPQAQAGQQAWQPPANWPTPAFYGAMRQAPSWAQQTYLPQMGYGR